MKGDIHLQPHKGPSHNRNSVLDLIYRIDRYLSKPLTSSFPFLQNTLNIYIYLRLWPSMYTRSLHGTEAPSVTVSTQPSTATTENRRCHLSICLSLHLQNGILYTIKPVTIIRQVSSRHSTFPRPESSRSSLPVKVDRKMARGGHLNRQRRSGEKKERRRGIIQADR